MLLNILQSVMLTSVGNAYLRGRDVGAFWPDAEVFAFTETCAFLVPERFGADEYRQVAADPLAWFQYLRTRGCTGLRLHHLPSVRGPRQTLAVKDREMVGFVGGGPRWLIEEVGAQRSLLWQGFDRIGDQNHPQRKSWRTAFLQQGETVPQDAAPRSVESVRGDLQALLPRMADLAREVGMPHFAECFERALAPAERWDKGTLHDAEIFAHFNDAQRHLLWSIMNAWVFGGMGSWNDFVPDAHHNDLYERLTDELFATLTDAIAALASSTYQPA